MIYLNSIACESQRVETVTTGVLDCSRRLTQRLSNKACCALHVVVLGS